MFDYNDPECVAKIKASANDNLQYVWDTISTDSSREICARVLATGGRYGCIVGGDIGREDVKYSFSLGYYAMGEPIDKGFVKKDDCTEDFEFAKTWIPDVNRLLAEGKIKPHPQKVAKGLDGVFEGMQLMREDKVSGQKLVYVL